MDLSRQLLRHCTPAGDGATIAMLANELTREAVHFVLNIQEWIPTESKYVVGQGGYACGKLRKISVPDFQRMSEAGLRELVSRGGGSADLEAYGMSTKTPGKGMLAHIKPDKQGNCTIQEFEFINAGQLKAELFKNPKKDLFRKDGLTDPKKLDARAVQGYKLSGVVDQKCGFFSAFVAEGFRRLGYGDVIILTSQTKHRRINVLLDRHANIQFYPFAWGTSMVQQQAMSKASIFRKVLDEDIIRVIESYLNCSQLCAMTDHAVMVVNKKVLIDPTVYQNLPKDTRHVLNTKTPTPWVYATQLPPEWESGFWSCRPRLGDIEMGETLFGPETPSRQNDHVSYEAASLHWFGAQYAGQVNPADAFDLMEEHMENVIKRIRENKLTPADMGVWQ